MKVIAVDDEALALNSLVRVLKQVFKDTDIQAFQKSREALEIAATWKGRGERIDYAFLDVEMRGIDGIELAKRLKEICPTVRILFVSAYDHYACQAFQLHAKGYILKPATKQMVEETLDSMEIEWRKQAQEVKKAKVRVQTFGNFDVFIDQKILTFERSKSKELFAYLIDRRGSGVTTAEIASVLWEDVAQGKRMTNHVQQVIYSMMRSLREVGVEYIIIKKWNYLAINPEQIECDYYQFLQGDSLAINSYMGEYMSQYSWAEMTTAKLEERVRLLSYFI